MAKGSDSKAVRAAFAYLRANPNQCEDLMIYAVLGRAVNPNPFTYKDVEMLIAIMIVGARTEVPARRWLCDAAAQCLADRVDLPKPLRLWLVERLRETARECDAGKGFGITKRNKDKPGNVTDWRQTYLVAHAVWVQRKDKRVSLEKALANVAATISTKEDAVKRCWSDFEKAFPEPKNERKKPMNIVRNKHKKQREVAR